MSVIALTDDAGAILERYAYNAYGDPVVLNGSGTVISSSAEGNRYTYTGREWDADLALYHFRARMYDPEVGRFLGRDPAGYFDATMLYGYAGNSPRGILRSIRLGASAFSKRYCVRAMARRVR
jgi:RHS repeat-associated protein